MTDLSKPWTGREARLEYIRTMHDIQLGVEGLKRLYVLGKIGLDAFENRVARVLESQLNE